MSDALRYAVVLSGPEPAVPGVLAKALAPLKRQPVQDLLLPMRHSRGLIELDCEEAFAKSAVEALKAAGVAALAVPSSLLEEAPAAESVHELTPKPKVVRLLAAAVFRQATTRVVTQETGPAPGMRALKIGLSLATGLPLVGFGGGKKVEQKTVESGDLVYHLDVYTGEPLRRLRVAAHDFDYSCLGERMGFDAPGNFRRLIEWLAPAAGRLNPGARGVLDGRPVRELGYESLQDLDREGRWLLTLDGLKR